MSQEVWADWKQLKSTKEDGFITKYFVVNFRCNIYQSLTRSLSASTKLDRRYCNLYVFFLFRSVRSIGNYVDDASGDSFNFSILVYLDYSINNVHKLCTTKVNITSYSKFYCSLRETKQIQLINSTTKKIFIMFIEITF